MKHVPRNTNRSRCSGTKGRRAARVRISLVLACALGVLLAGVAVFREVVPWKPESDGVAVAIRLINDPEPEDEGGGGTNPDPVFIPDAQPGAPRPWESSTAISTYSVVNMLNRNVHTVIPIVSWTGIGPPMSMNLYHNSATVDSVIDLTRGMGFDLGPGWTTSFSAHLSNDLLGNRLVISDDGTRNTFKLNGAQWDGPPGVYDVLTFDEVAQKYTLKHKDQSYDEFDADGLLIAVSDALGNKITIQRVDGRLDTVTDAAGRILQFVYDGVVLDKIIDPIELEDEVDPNEPDILEEREWTILYGFVPGLDVVDPMGFRIGMYFDSEGRIERIVDKHAPLDFDNFPWWTVYEYDIAFQRDRDALRRVTDPLNLKQGF
ncbi:MAG: RHS repeat protein [Planctomycetes bacterium]|nr:RHS repeat protein [Planctomycetota bacterium]